MRGERLLSPGRAGLLALAVALATASGPAAADFGGRVVRVASGLERPLYVTTPPGDPARLFIVEQHSGRIRILDLASGTVKAEPFLDIDDLAVGGEQGLLGLAFHPDYASNGFFYVNLTVTGGATEVRRYRRSDDAPDRADPFSAQLVIGYDQPFANHNGGWLGFGPDGFLYIASGDGGGGGDPGNRAQDITDQRLGKILRLDVDGDDFLDSARNYAIPDDNPFVGGGGDDEIWAFGLRNPWRASFDRATGDLYIADVGQGRREEINFQPASSPGGENYGWNVMEGSECFGASGPGLPACFDPALVPPIHDYPHGGPPDGGDSVTGGYVYRGPIADLQGTYFFADFVSDQIWSFRYDGSTLTEFANRTAEFAPDQGSMTGIASFGEDAAGNLYIVDIFGDVFRLEPPEAPSVQLLAAVLPSSRAVPLGATATAFATVINAAGSTAAGCSIAPAQTLAAEFHFQTTDPTSNVVTGTRDAAVDIPPSASQTFVIGLTPAAALAPTAVAFDFTCSNRLAAARISGVNDLLLSADPEAGPDLVALVAAAEDGIVTLGGPSLQGAFAVALANVGTAGRITVSADDNGHGLPLTLGLCETNPGNGVCLGPIAGSLGRDVEAGATASFAVFLDAAAPIAFDPAGSRVFVRFRDAAGVLRGATSIAVRSDGG